MAEDKKQLGGIRISEPMLIFLALIIGAVFLAAVLIVPRYASTFAAYRQITSEYKSAQADFDAALKENDELSVRLEEMENISKEAASLKDEAMTLAPQVEQAILDGKSNKKICYLTLDDGPYNRGKEFLEMFDKYNVKATFFLTTANGDKLPDQADLTATSMYPEYLKHGHTIGNHTYSHNYGDGGIYKSTKAFMKSVNKQQEFTKEATGGYTPQIVRFPGGTSMAGDKKEAMEKALREAGLTWIDWTVDSGDSWGSDKASPKLVTKNIMKAAKDQKVMVVLCHEWSKNSLEALPGVIESLQEQGYIFLPLFPESAMVQK